MNIFIARNGQTLGPFDLATINAQLHSGQLLPQDLAWSEGMRTAARLGRKSEGVRATEFMP